MSASLHTHPVLQDRPVGGLPHRGLLTGDTERDGAVWHRLVCQIVRPDGRPTGILVGGDLHPRERIALAQLHEWVRLGIDHIVDCRGEHTDERLVRVHAPHVVYTHVGTDDAGYGQSDEWFEEGVSEALSTVLGGGTVYLHCHMGINRGPSMTFALLLALGWGVREALDAIVAARPIVGVLYATDAVRWIAGREGWSTSEHRAAQLEVEEWFLEHDIDISRVIRNIRDGVR